MKSKFLFIILTLLLAKVSFGQEISKSDIVKFKIKSITTIDADGKSKYTEFYNNKGDFIKQGSPDDNKQLQINRELLYNDSLLIEERTYASKGDINGITKYYYNDKNQILKKKSISSGEIDATWAYEYDNNGNRVTEKQTSSTMGKSLANYKYDNNNLLVQEDKTNNTIGKEERVNYKYNEKRQVIEKKTKSYYFNTTVTLTYYYNEIDRLIKLLEKSSNGVSSTTTYEYNDSGLLMSDTWEDSLSKTPQKNIYQRECKINCVKS
jgi:YD repeat-containing protein